MGGGFSENLVESADDWDQILKLDKELHDQRAVETHKTTRDLRVFRTVVRRKIPDCERLIVFIEALESHLGWCVAFSLSVSSCVIHLTLNFAGLELSYEHQCRLLSGLK